MNIAVTRDSEVVQLIELSNKPNANVLDIWAGMVDVARGVCNGGVGTIVYVPGEPGTLLPETLAIKIHIGTLRLNRIGKHVRISSASGMDVIAKVLSALNGHGVKHTQTYLSAEQIQLVIRTLLSP